MKFSVLMSVYHKENPDFLRLSLESVWNQTLRPDQIVLVKDGPLTPQLEAEIEAFSQVCPVLKLLPLPENVGLGKALNAGLEACDYSLVARMDTDDIALPHRFASQVAAFAEDPELDICGSHALEFEGTPDHVTAHKRVPITDQEIRRYARRRNPFNHPTVMYRKQAVLAAGSYQHALWFEDYYLWARMLANGCRACNIDDDLLYFRAGSDMFRRRGGLRYVKSAVSVKWKIYRMGVSGLGDFLYSTAAHSVVALMPNRLRSAVYARFLRK